MNSGRRVIIVAGGAPPPADLLLQIIGDSDLLMAVNGGAAALLGARIRPDVIVGDLDSVPPGAKGQYEELGIEVRLHPAEKEKSDLELALDEALAETPGDIMILGALGGRLDHLLTNVHLLIKCWKRKVFARLLGEGVEAFMADPNTEVRGLPGFTISLIPLSAKVTGITLTGLQYPLYDETLYQGSSRGLSNVMTGSSARIRKGAGRLLVVVTQPIPPRTPDTISWN